jgi:hypothetical protein
MADVTSSSRRARQLYSQAAALMTGDGPWNTVGAEQFLRDALREDPVFPSARTLTAWVLYNQRRPPQEYLPYAEDADRSAAALPDAERYFIVGSAHHLRALATEDAVLRRQELAKAAGAYEAVLRTQPEHPWALTNIQYLFTRLADPVAEQPVVERLAAVRPDTFSVNVRALWLALLAGDERRAEPFATRCHELLAAGASHDADGASLVRVFVAQRAWLRNEAEEALRAADAVLPVLGDLSGVERVRLGDHLADLYLSLGATTRARQVAAMLPEDDSYARERITAAILWQRGDEPQLKRHLVRLFQNPSAAWRLTSMFIDVGLLDAARALLRHQQDRGTQRTFLEHGQLRLRLATSPSPDPSEIQRLADALHARSGFDFRPRDFGLALQLSAILDARGDSVQAIQLLEKLSTRRTAATAYAAGHLWMDVRVRLGELYHRSGRNGDAHAVEAELLRLLAAGDADRPRLSALQRHDHLR